jgi:hypothetical protein
MWALGIKGEGEVYWKLFSSMAKKEKTTIVKEGRILKGKMEKQER